MFMYCGILINVAGHNFLNKGKLTLLKHLDKIWAHFLMGASLKVSLPKKNDIIPHYRK